MVARRNGGDGAGSACAFCFLGGSFYFRFATLGAVAIGWIATAYYVYGVDTVPESHRYAIEFELFIALALMEAFRLTLQNQNSTIRMCAMGTAGVMLLVGSPQLWALVTQGWNSWAPVAPETTLEYKLAQWLSERHPTGRVLATADAFPSRYVVRCSADRRWLRDGFAGSDTSGYGVPDPRRRGVRGKGMRTSKRCWN